MWHAHTKTSQLSPLSFIYKTENEYIQQQPTTNMGGFILLSSILLKISQVSFVFSKNPKSDPLSSHFWFLVLLMFSPCVSISLQDLYLTPFRSHCHVFTCAPIMFFGLFLIISQRIITICAPRKYIIF